MEVRVKQKIDYYAGYALIGLLLPFTRLLGITMRRDHTLKAAPRRILFIKLLGLGSLIVASDAIAAIRSRYPNARLILLTDGNIAAGIAPFQVFDEIHVVNSNHLFSTAQDVLRFLFRSWRWRGLWVIDLEVYSKLTTVFALMTLARNRFGFYLSPVPFRKYLNTHNVVFDQDAFLEDNYDLMVDAVAGVENGARDGGVRGGDGGGARAEFGGNGGGVDVREIGDEGGGVVGEEWGGRDAGGGEGGRVSRLDRAYIIVNNTCSSLADERKLPEKTVADICRWVLDNTSYGLAILGMPSDKAGIDELIAREPGLRSRQQRILNYAGQAGDFPGYYRFLREKGVCLVTIDSGPLHIARKLGLPTVSVWGPTDPANYLKIAPAEKDRHLYFYLKTPCSPCVHRYHPLPCGGNNFCMKNIPSSGIILKISELLQNLD